MTIEEDYDRGVPPSVEAVTGENKVETDSHNDQPIKTGVKGHILRKRGLGTIGATSLIVNEIIGSGIFATPGIVYRNAGSPGMAMACWLIGCGIALCGTILFIELGIGIPRSGGIKNYLEISYKPRLMQCCLYAAFGIFLQTSAASSITFAQYAMTATGHDNPSTWTQRSFAIAGMACGTVVHATVPWVGRQISNVLAIVKIFVLFFIITCGFIARDGKVLIVSDMLSKGFRGSTTSPYHIATAVLYVVFSISGYDNANSVLSEVHNPQRTLKTALPVAISVITVLYLLVNFAYFAAVPTVSWITEDGIIAVRMVENVFGSTTSIRVMSALVALSVLGRLLSMAFSMSRMIHELAKDGILPLSTIMMEKRPFKTPIPGLLLHLGVGAFYICIPPPGQAFAFIVSLATYPTLLMYLLIAIGLVKLRLSKKNPWTSSFHAPWIIIAVYMAGNIFLLIMGFWPPAKDVQTGHGLPWWLSPTMALGVLSSGITYYFLRWEGLPRWFGYRLVETRCEMRDGSFKTRYVVVPREAPVISDCASIES